MLPGGRRHLAKAGAHYTVEQRRVEIADRATYLRVPVRYCDERKDGGGWREEEEKGEEKVQGKAFEEEKGILGCSASLLLFTPPNSAASCIHSRKVSHWLKGKRAAPCKLQPTQHKCSFPCRTRW